MDKILVICNTYFQFIVATQLKLTKFNESEVLLIVTDKTPGFKYIKDNIIKTELFNQVLFLPTKELCDGKKSFAKKIRDTKCALFGDKNYEFLNESGINKILFFNQDLFSMIIVRELTKTNKELSICRYEEGILSYNSVPHLGKRLSIANNILHALNKKTVIYDVSDFYCFFPELYTYGSTVKIEKISSNSCLGEKLKEVFSIDDSSLNYTERFIYFSSVFDFEGGSPIGEIDVMRDLASIIGNENFKVKIHPRDTRETVRDTFNIDKNKEIPWEAIQLCINCLDKCLITVNSASVLSLSLMQDEMPEIIFAFSCCQYSKNKDASRVVDNIKTVYSDMIKNIPGNRVHFLENINDIRNYI